MSIGVMKDQKPKLMDLLVSHTLEGCTPRSTTSTFRKYNGSYIHIQKLQSFIGKEKVFVPPSESICTTFRIFKKGCCFSLNVVFGTPFYHFLL